ncbi:PTS system mannose/fructose/sorbose family transporter subunit IID [Clostridium chromiireducens]|uniref:PTS system mannose/fructose/sorbose family transporter subunit IID n=1 Tax=Clostridium chromiireducens TaxID=225345 RepID=A0A399IH85_9CLOT|nr:PTS system mannose/fructose/sorbose family transporter subunit IID [Clostridium chromiireducens]RII32313.1 PTS system mannose/fructose/sorbose family transporter subunit IID [Clostridium chromiireducens]
MSNNFIKDIPVEERKLLRKTFWRSFTLYSSVSPAKQGASGFCYSMMPFINKFYTDSKDKKEALVRNMSYFNTTIPVSTFIMGLTASMEKENSMRKDFDTTSINAVKSSLMGPMAGIGDSIFWGVIRVIAAGIAVSMGQSGNILAPIVFLLLFNIPSIAVKYYGTFLGYSLGSKYIEKLYSSGLINILTKAASIVGLIMVGGMTSQMVTFKTTIELKMGGASVLKLQEMLDQIFIGIIPLGITLLCFYLLQKKKISINILLIGVIILGILISALGIA